MNNLDLELIMFENQIDNIIVSDAYSLLLLEKKRDDNVDENEKKTKKKSKIKKAAKIVAAISLVTACVATMSIIIKMDIDEEEKEMTKALTNDGKEIIKVLREARKSSDSKIKQKGLRATEAFVFKSIRACEKYVRTGKAPVALKTGLSALKTKYREYVRVMDEVDTYIDQNRSSY